MFRGTIKPSGETEQLKFGSIASRPSVRDFTTGELQMSDDPSKKQNDPTQGGGQTGQQQQGQQSGQQRNTDDGSQKRPSQGGTDAEQDQEKQDQGGQRRAS